MLAMLGLGVPEILILGTCCAGPLFAGVLTLVIVKLTQRTSPEPRDDNW